MGFWQLAFITLLGSLPVVSGGIFTWMRSRRTTNAVARIDNAKVELESRRVESAAYQNAQKITDDVVVGLRAEIDRLRADLRAEREGRAEDNKHYTAEIAELRKMVSKLSADLADLDVARSQRQPRTARTRRED